MSWYTQRAAALRPLPSFPTRRSSDLGLCGPGRPAPAQGARAEPAQAGPVGALARPLGRSAARWRAVDEWDSGGLDGRRSEEHTSELQSPCNLVCRLLREKKKITSNKW